MLKNPSETQTPPPPIGSKKYIWLFTGAIIDFSTGKSLLGFRGREEKEKLLDGEIGAE